MIVLCLQFVKSEKCPERFEAPQKCFDIEEILDYVEVAKKLEEANKNYLEILTEGGFVVDETEVSEKKLFQIFF